MKTTKLLLFVFITSFCIGLTSCNSEDDALNIQPESELKAIGGSTGTGGIIVNHRVIEFDKIGMGWKDGIYPTQLRPKMVVINSPSDFDAVFSHEDLLPGINFNNETIIAVQFYSSYYIGSGSESWIKKQLSYTYLPSTSPVFPKHYHMKIVLERSRYDIVQPATCAPTVMIAVPKLYFAEMFSCSVTTEYIN